MYAGEEKRNVWSLPVCGVYRQAHVYIIAGACLSLGFRFAGSENLAAFNCLVRGFYSFPPASAGNVTFYLLGKLP